MRTRLLITATALALGLGACTMPLQTRSGLTGAAILPSQELAILPPTEEDDAGREAARAVSAELQRRGYVITPDAPTRLEIAVSTRPSLTAVEDDSGALLSGPRNRRAIKLCKGSVHRLALAATDTRRLDKPEPTRGWAEQYRCSGEPIVSITKLSRMAVDALAGANASRRGGG